jgi:hypothetical protein
MDGPSAAYVERLRAHFPGVRFQGKGLIATEAFVSLPLTGHDGSVLAVTSHFYEFLPVDPQTYEVSVGRPLLAHQLERGRIYSVVVTTGGGLYRYHMHDLVQVVGWVRQAPCLRFLGKGSLVSDWFGEKLHERFVAGVLEALFCERGIAPIFAMLAPDDRPPEFRYTLYLELAPDERHKADLTGLAQDLDRRLAESFHYDYCRRLGQLAEAEIFWSDRGAAQAYLRAREAEGQRLGNVKPAALQNTTGWDRVFQAAATSPSAHL